MLKSSFTGKGRLFLSLSLIGLLFAYSAPKALAQAAQADPAQNGAQVAPPSNDQAPPPNAAPPDAQQPPNVPPADQGMSNSMPNPPNAAPAQNAANQADPPSRAARISFFEGSVSLQPGGQGDWGNAVRNRPVTVGDKIWVDKDSRAELQAGQVTVHLGSMTALSFLNLDGPVTQMRVAEGSINFRVREMREGDIYEVDTPNAVFTVKQAGAFRIDVSENGDGTRVTVIRGGGDVLAAGQNYTIHPGDRAEFVGTDGNVQYSVHGAPPPDGLDRWANDRDLRDDNSVSARYVNRDVPGYSDLDDNGTWSEQPDVGSVWTPNDVAPGWAPYSDGSWNYVGPWGWSWVGAEPWGFAPYHYGRWGFYGGGWGWAPGPIWAPPFYGPAFVGFLGGGFGFGLGFGGGFGVGWFPLGFGEPFHPWYHAGLGYVNNINIHNTAFRNTSVINSSHSFNYAYAHNTNAVTTASRSSFTNGESINRGTSRVSPAALNSAHVTNGAGFSPGKSSYLGAGHTGAGVATPPSTVQNRSVMARTTPAAGASSLAVHNVTASAVAGNRSNTTVNASRTAATNSARYNSSTRSWSAQGNVTDRGSAPQGAGHNPSVNNGVQTAHNLQSDRPDWARAGASNTARTNGVTASRGNSAATNYGNRVSSANTNRSYSAPSRAYSAPSRGYSAPSHGNSAPSHSSGGGSSHASSGGSHGGGGGSHGGGHR